jgi:uncharacterized protein YdaU (DUF1376 family)
MKTNLFFKINPMELLTDEITSTLSNSEIGMALRLWSRCFLQGDIPADLKKLARILNATDLEMIDAWQNLQYLFEPVNEQRLISKRITEQLKAIEAASDLAKTKINKRWQTEEKSQKTTSNTEVIPNEYSSITDKDKDLNTVVDESLTPEIARDEFSELGQQAQDYLAQINNPSLTNVSWVSGYFCHQCRQILNTRKDIKPEDVLTCWRGACDVTADKAKGVQYLKAVFEGKLKDWQPVKPMQAKGIAYFSKTHDPNNPDCQCRDCAKLQEYYLDCERQQAIEKTQGVVTHGC